MIIHSHGGLDCNRYEAKKINRLIVLRMLGRETEADQLAKLPIFARLKARGVISYEPERGEELFIGGYTWTIRGEDGAKEYKYRDGRWYRLNAAEQSPQEGETP